MCTFEDVSQMYQREVFIRNQYPIQSELDRARAEAQGELKLHQGKFRNLRDFYGYSKCTATFIDFEKFCRYHDPYGILWSLLLQCARLTLGWAEGSCPKSNYSKVIFMLFLGCCLLSSQQIVEAILKHVRQDQALSMP